MTEQTAVDKAKSYFTNKINEMDKWLDTLIWENKKECNLSISLSKILNIL